LDATGEQMKTYIKIIIEKLFPILVLHYRAYKNLVQHQNSYLYLTGWMQSLKERKPVDNIGNPIPWMNFAVVNLLGNRLSHDLDLFEFGSGYSTLFFASRVRSVTSVEYDRKWFDLIKLQTPENVMLIFIEKDVDGNYCRVINSSGKQYDVVVVDGRDRVNCMKQGVAALSQRGVIILDDSQRSDYQEGIEFVKRKGFRTLSIEGLKATTTGIDRTTIFYREENCLDI
jgi:hypothetical protein